MLVNSAYFKKQALKILKNLKTFQAQMLRFLNIEPASQNQFINEKYVYEFFLI